jgi:hypothetical protein
MKSLVKIVSGTIIGLCLTGCGILDPDDTKIRSIKPNPFSKETTISYFMKNSGNVTFDVVRSGKVISTLGVGSSGEGEHGYNWMTKNLKGGSYTVIMNVNGKPYDDYSVYKINKSHK